MRLIDADRCWNYFYGHLTDDGIVGAMNAIKEMPTVDAVPVVRCKDCRWYSAWRTQCEVDDAFGYKSDDYCSYGERREAEE